MSTWTTPEKRTARKEHWCEGCFRRIHPGETYTHQRGFDGGDVWTFRQCAHCLAVTELYDPRDTDGCISQDGYDAWTDNRPRDWTEARHMAGWNMRWRTTSGTLLPIPTREDQTHD